MAGRSDAATDRVTLTSAPTTTALTVAGWARIDSAAGGSFNPIARLYVNSGDASSWIIGFKGANGRTPSVYSPSNTSGISAPEVGLGTWLYVAATLNAGAAQLLYGTVPGVLSKVSGTVAASGTADRVTFFGRSAADGSEWLAGALAYQRIWTVVLSDAEIAAESQSTTAARTSNLFGHWPFAAAALTDTSGNGRSLTAGTTPLDADADPVLDTGPAPLLITSGFHGPGPFGHRAPWLGTDQQVTASATQAGDVALSGTGSLTAAADAAKPLIGTLSAVGALTAAAATTKPASAALTATGVATATAATDKPAAATLTGVVTVTAAATVDTAAQTAAATLTGTGTVTAGADTGKPIAGSLTGTLAATADAAASKTLAASLAGTGTLGASTTATKPANTALTGTVATTAAATTTKPAAASLTGVGSITADAVVGTAPVSAAATLTGTATITAAAARTSSPNADLVGLGTFTAAASAVKPIGASLTAAGTFTASGARTLTASAVLTAAGQFTVTAAVPQAVTRGDMQPSSRTAASATPATRAAPAMTPTARTTATMGGE